MILQKSYKKQVNLKYKHTPSSILMDSSDSSTDSTSPEHEQKREKDEKKAFDELEQKYKIELAKMCNKRKEEE